jgi:hypothetical protein
MAKRERDASMEQLLREALADRDRSPQSECLDAEMLAAWSDGALSGAERSFAEAHAARCARCQALLATMVRTEPPETRVAPAFSIRKWVTFLTPAAAAAAALALWFLVEPRQTAPLVPRPAPQIADAPAAQPPSAPPAEPTQAAPARADKETETKREVDGALAARSSAARRGRDIPTAPEDVRAKDKDTGARAASAAPPAVPPPAGTPAADPTAALAKAAEQQLRSEQLRAGVEERAAKPLATPPPPSVQSADARSQRPAADQQQASQSRADLKQTERQLADALARQEAERGGGAGRGGATFNLVAAAFTLAPPQSDVRWRVTSGRVIEHSVDAGATWATQYMAPDKTVLVAGAAPSPAAAWIVGRAGTVLLTSDGRSWQRVRFPQAANLIAVNAVDAVTASVVTADKRTFVTTDGGLTWIERKE